MNEIAEALKKEYTVVDEATGREITFDWEGDTPPTQDDMLEVFAAARPEHVAPLPDTPESRVPEWGIESPNLYGVYGAGKALLGQAVTPTFETVGMIGGSVFSPIVGTSLGYGIGKKIGEILEYQYGLLENPDVSSLPAHKELIGSAIDVGTSIALGKGTDYFTKRILAPIDQRITETVTNAFKRGVKPTVVGKGNARLVKEFYGDATTAIKSIVRNSKGPLPKNMEEASQAVYDTKAQIWKGVEDISTRATEKGIGVDLSSTINEMRKIGSSHALKRVNIAESDRLLTMADEWEKLGTRITPNQAEDLLSMLNNASKSWWKNPTPADTHSAINYVRTANNVRKALFDAIPEGKAYANLRSEYGALSAVEKDITHRATVFGRRNPKGFFDLAGIWGTGKFIHGLGKMDPTMMVAGAAEKGLVKAYQAQNSPDRIIRKMFNKVEKQMIKQGEIPPRVSRSSSYLDEPAENFIGENLRPEEGVYRYNPQASTYKSQSPIDFKSAESVGPPRYTSPLRPDQLSRLQGKTPVSAREVKIGDIAREQELNPRTLFKSEPPSIRGDITVRTRREAELSRELRTTPKPSGRKPGVTADTIKSREIVNQFRKKEGLPPISKFDYNKQREFEIQEATKKINEFRAKKGLPPIKID